MSPASEADLEAKQDQGQGHYPGVDDWRRVEKSPGDFLAQFDYRHSEEIYPESNPIGPYFTDDKTLERHIDSADKKVDAQQLAEAVQVRPYLDLSDDTYKYSRNVAVYKVIKDLPGAESEVNNNPVHGKGGAYQFYSEKPPEALIQEGYLERVEVLPAKNREHQSELFKTVEEKEIKPVRVPELIHREHNQIKDRMWDKGSEEDKEQVLQMDRLENESAMLKGKPPPNKSRVPIEQEEGKAPNAHAEIGPSRLSYMITVSHGEDNAQQYQLPVTLEDNLNRGELNQHLNDTATDFAKRVAAKDHIQDPSDLHIKVEKIDEQSKGMAPLIDQGISK